MDSVPFLTSLIAVVWLVLWFFRSDKRPANEPMIGIFALRQTARPKPTRVKIGARPTTPSTDAAMTASTVSGARKTQTRSDLAPGRRQRD